MYLYVNFYYKEFLLEISKRKIIVYKQLFYANLINIKILSIQMGNHSPNNKLSLNSLNDFQPSPPFRYQILSTLGSGSFGTVFKIWDLDDNQMYALKKMEIDANNSNSQQEILKEIYILKSLQEIDPKPLLIPVFYGYCRETTNEKSSFLLKFELKDGNLHSLIAEKLLNKARFSFETLRKWTIVLIKGLAYLQSKGICHRDLKSENILYSYQGSLQNKDFRLTITDFGESSMNIQKTNLIKTIHIRGTFANLAPELRLAFFRENAAALQYNPYKSDAFSLGIVLLQIGLLKLPYNGNNEKNLDVNNIKSGNFQKELQTMIKELIEYYTSQAKTKEEKKLIKNYEQFLDKLLDVDPENRADFFELFQEINKLATPQELLGTLSEEIRQESLEKEEIKPKHTKKNMSFSSKSEKIFAISPRKSTNPGVSPQTLPKDGCCEVVLPSGDRYFGQFLDGKKHGKGILRTSGGAVYKGDFVDDEFSGYGEYFFENGDHYIGEFNKGKRQGRGVFKFKGVGLYEGYWEDGYQHGYGEFFWENGEKFRGEFLKGKKHGQGNYEYADGKKYQGQWKEDMKEGNGTLELNEEEKFVGEFHNDIFHGKGVMISKNGGKKAGIWKEGVLVEKNDECRVF